MRLRGLFPGCDALPSPRPKAAIFAGVVALLGATVLVVASHVTDLPPGLHRHLGFAVVAALLGATAGGAELVSRYRDEPFHAAASNPGVVYLVLNAVVAGLVYGLSSVTATRSCRD